jgi:transposase
MVKTKMYRGIQQMKLQGHNISRISSDLRLDRKTVRKYYYMNEVDYQNYQQKLESRNKLLDPFKSDILKIYQSNDNLKLNMAAVYDYLVELHGELPCSEKTLRNLINHMILDGELSIKRSIRQYIKVPELPYGKQLQLDFGYYTMPSGLRIYIFTAVLSASRYKCIFFHNKQFTTLSLIGCLLDCFDFIGGIPQEIVIDQDTVMVASENSGDIIYTKDFGVFKDEMGFSMFVCRKSDPESKGKVENLVKFVKNSFLKLRDFLSIEEAQLSLMSWLYRRANGRISHATAKIPAILHEEEKKYLKPLKNSIFRKDRMIYREERIVNDQSYLSHASSQYSVPVKYKCRTVEIFLSNDDLMIFDPKTGEMIACHRLSMMPGQKISLKSHFRENEKPIRDFKSETFFMFDFPEWKQFVDNNFSSYPRYVRDQCISCRKLFSPEMNKELLKEAIFLCIENKCNLFKDLKHACDSLLRERQLNQTGTQNICQKPVNRKYSSIQVNKRDLNIYQKEMEAHR